MKRLDYIDSAKGILIILVILGHIFFKHRIMYFAYTFHLSTFPIITGILSAHTGKPNRLYLKNVSSEIYTLVIPFIFFETIGGIIKVLLGTDLTLFQLFINPLAGRYHVSADWYIQTLFFSEMLFFGIERIISSKPVKIALYSTMFAIGCILPRHGFRFLIIDRTFIITSMIAVGFYLYRVYTNINYPLIIASFCLVCICTVANGYVSLYSITIGNPIIYAVGVIFGAYLCISLCHLFPSKLLALVGNNSLILMGTHQNIIYNIPINKILLTIIVLVVEVPVVWIIKTFFPNCVGLKRKR